jgi:hypothetical protein
MSNNMARATFSVDDSRKLEKNRAKLSRLEGVHSVGINVLSQMVYIEYDPQKISIEKIRTALRRPR